MHSIVQVLAQIAGTKDCLLLPPAGQPSLPPRAHLPVDLSAFYSEAGGATLFGEADYPYTILGPSFVAPTNLRLLGHAKTGDVSDHWFTIAEDGNGDVLSIDLRASHVGRCYDSFHETHGLVGSTPVIATSFTELLCRLLANGGARPYWLASGFSSLGDAYDGNSEA
jgi:antitoxin YokJ